MAAKGRWYVAVSAEPFCRGVWYREYRNAAEMRGEKVVGLLALVACEEGG